MLGSEKGGRRGGGDMRTTFLRYLPVLLTVILLTSFQSVNAAGELASGTTEQMGNNLPRGTTAYVVYYSYPSTVDVGTNLTIALTLHVNSLTGLVEYLINYDLEVHVFIGTSVLTGSVTSGNESLPLYPGGNWGPNDVVIPLTAANTGLAEGQSTNATIGITLRDFVFYGIPFLTYSTEPAMQSQAGSVIIQNVPASTSTTTTGQAAGQTYVPYALLASGVVLMVSALLLPRGPRPSQPDQK
jgi:hypothetical protein